MIPNLVAWMRAGAKKIAAAFIAKTGAAVTKYAPTQIARAGTGRLIVPTGSGNAIDAGKRYRLTSDHAPIFSLYTFFTNR